MSIIGDIHEEWADRLRLNLMAELDAILAWPLCDSAKVDAVRWSLYRFKRIYPLAEVAYAHVNALRMGVNPYLYMSEVCGL